MQKHYKPTGTELVSAQARLLEAFSGVSRALRGITALLWLPGIGQKFDGPRAIRGTRPLAVTLEVTDSGGLSLAGSIAFPRETRMQYATVFRYEFTQPMAPRAVGEALSSKKEVLARRALELLKALVRFGERRAYQPRSAPPAAPQWPRLLVPFNPGEVVFDEAKLSELACEMSPELWETYRAALAQELCDSATLPGTTLVDARIVDDAIVAQAVERKLAYEDHSPALGVWQWNPARRLQEMANPAHFVLKKHGVTDVGVMSQETLDAVVEHFRRSVPLGERLSEEEIFDALCNPRKAVKCARGVDGIAPGRIITAMRRLANKHRSGELATTDDLLAAARNPDGPLVLSRMSKIQVVSTDALQDLPSPYCGHFLPAVDWQQQFQPAEQPV